MVIHMRILKKAREKMRKANSPQSSRASTSSSETVLTNANFQKMYLNTINQIRANEKSLIEIFFDLEAEIEKGICRDCISYNSNEIEDSLWRFLFYFSRTIYEYSLKISFRS